ncbi:MAG: hypothetical protein J7K37_01330 [Candidatus Omnitrophica bacterium]|nr:hypothetical protein [Candidatus Omnitrophota bacterium]
MKKGVILIIALSVLTALVVIGGGYFSYVISEKKEVDRTLARRKAFYLAEAGLDIALTRMRSGSMNNFSGNLGEGSYTVNIQNLGSLIYQVSATGEVSDSAGNLLSRQTLSIYAKDAPFNVYSYFTNSEYYTLTFCFWGWCWVIQQPVWFIGGDTLHGPVFTNSEFHISGNPAFYGPVGSHGDTITYMHGPPQDNPYFDPNYSPNPNLGQPIINAPSSFDDDSSLQALKTQGEYFYGDTTIVFKSDGTMDVTNAARGWINHNMPVPSGEGIFVDSGNLYIKGVLDGEITLGAEDQSGNKGNIVITDNLRLKSRYDEEETLREGFSIPSDSDDYLGLIAEKNVIVSKNAPYDVEIDASIMALGGSFIVESWYDPNYNKGTLTVLGGIVQLERGPVGTFSQGGKVSGYSKNYIYDERLSHQILPYFPTTKTFEVISWRKE